jgi:lipoate---protein ligase
VLRLWEAPRPFVVIGRSSRIAEEVNLAAASAWTVIRRCSGGAAVVAGPGCLMYAVVLSYERRPALRVIDAAHRFVLSQLAAALRPQLPDVQLAGTSDLAWNNQKISGNSMRCKRSHMLYHGTLLYDFRLELISQILSTAPRQPAYRGGRTHGDFVTNAPIDCETLKDALRRQWNAQETRSDWPQHRVAELVAQRYGRDDWTHSR